MEKDGMRFTVNESELRRETEPWVRAGECVMQEEILSQGTENIGGVAGSARAEQALLESENLYRSLFQNLLSGFAYCRIVTEGGKPRDFVFLAVNGAFEAQTGLKNVLGKRASVVIPGIREADPHFLEICGRVAMNGQSARFEKFVEALQTWYSISVYSPAPGHFAVLFDVITQRKQAEMEKVTLEEQLRHAQKMESVGRLAGGVAHDFNNMLSVIIGHTNLAMMSLDPGQSLHAHMEEILKAAERSADLTRQLLAFARKQTIAPKVLVLSEIVAGILKMLKRLIGEPIDLIWKHEEDLWPVKIDPSQIDQVLANLCVNASDSIADQGKISIETRNCLVDEGYCASNAGFVAGEYVRLSVSDNGCGMSAETRARIFEPFFTTKDLGAGTGLGLATVYGIVKQNGGFINVYSEPGLGTTFTIYLPRHPGGVEAACPEGVTGRYPRGHETILLVEDELAILEVVLMILNRQGYTVLQAGNPGDAVRLAEEHAGEIHLLLTDVVMPEMNGLDLAINLQYLYPRIKHLFMSGYTAEVIAHNGVLDQGLQFIHKPFSMPDLAAKVREVLDSD